ncbi:MAG: EF-hand domain-containing protein [Pseudomonadota bacterium]
MKIYFALACCLCSAGSWAQEQTSPPPQILQAPHADPYVPPGKRIAPSQPPASGAALQEQAMQKVKKQFDAADSRRTGTLTAEQARAAGLGYVAKNFEQIDARKTGKVSFDDVKAYMEQGRQKQLRRQGSVDTTSP